MNISFGSALSQPPIKEGNSVYLECTVWANPWISNLTWQFENRNLTTNKANGIIVKNQTLLLQNVNKDHRGRYRCLANNTIGEGRSKYLRLYVQCKLIFSFTFFQ